MNSCSYIHRSDEGFNSKHELMSLLWLDLELHALEGYIAHLLLDLGRLLLGLPILGKVACSKPVEST